MDDDPQEAEIRQLLLAEIRQYMEQQQPYLASDLSLEDIADTIGVNRNLVSETLNKGANKNFYGFVNEYRVARVCRLLTDPGCEKTILDIAFESGFF